jgi:hypothetical protein
MKKKTGLAALMTLDVAFLCFMALIGVAFLYDSRRINAMAAALPTYTAILMIGLILFVLYGKVRDAYRPAKPGPEAQAEASAGPTCEVVEGEPLPVTGRQLHWFVAWIMIATYPFLVMLLGFSIATFVFLAGVSIIMGTKPLTGVVYGVLGAAVLILLFIFILKVPMPDSTLSDYIPALLGY